MNRFHQPRSTRRTSKTKKSASRTRTTRSIRTTLSRKVSRRNKSSRTVPGFVNPRQSCSSSRRLLSAGLRSVALSGALQSAESKGVALPLDIALAGCGRWGRRILITLVAQGERVWVVDPSEEARREALARGAAGAAAEVSRPGSLDAAIVAVPTRRHAEVIESLAPRAVPIFCEKPLTDDAASAERLAAAHERLFVMDKWRYHPAVEELARLARTREIGRPRSLRTVRVQPEISGHDVDSVWILAPHEISIAREILGKVPRAVRAEGSSSGADAHSLSAACESGGVPFTFEVSSRAPGRRREVELACEKGAASWTLDREHEIEISGTGSRSVSPEPPLDRELTAFRDYVRGGPPPKTSAREGAAVVALIEELRALAGIRPNGRRSP